jgi:hypothetical protein
VNDDDAIAKLQAAFDQLNATLRDTFVPAIVQIESWVLGAGGSPDLAVEIALEYGRRMMDTANIGKR